MIAKGGQSRYQLPTGRTTWIAAQAVGGKPVVALDHERRRFPVAMSGQGFRRLGDDQVGTVKKGTAQELAALVRNGPGQLLHRSEPLRSALGSKEGRHGLPRSFSWVFPRSIDAPSSGAPCHPLLVLSCRLKGHFHHLVPFQTGKDHSILPSRSSNESWVPCGTHRTPRTRPEARSEKRTSCRGMMSSITSRLRLRRSGM